jgi:hypothetical protein
VQEHDHVATFRPRDDRENVAVEERCLAGESEGFRSQRSEMPMGSLIEHAPALYYMPVTMILVPVAAKFRGTVQFPRHDGGFARFMQLG